MKTSLVSWALWYSIFQMIPQTKSSFDGYSTLLDRYAEIARKAGKTVRRSAPREGERLFHSMTDERRKLLLSRLETEISVYEEILAAGEEILDSPRFLWRFFVKCGYVPCSDIFGKIGDTDVVEVIGMDQVHIHQNLNFFDWVSVTLDQVFCMTWNEMSTRDLSVEKLIYDTVVQMMSGASRTTMDPGVPWHEVKEIDTEMMLKFDLRLKWISPVYLKQKLVCLIGISECRNLVETLTP